MASRIGGFGSFQLPSAIFQCVTGNFLRGCLWRNFYDIDVFGPTHSIMIRSKNFTATVFRQKLLAAILFLCFGMLAGFSPLLHNHDFDLSDTHQDCVSCQWSNSSTSLETDASGLLFYHFSEVLDPTRSQLSHQHAFFLISNRGPPFSL